MTNRAARGRIVLGAAVVLLGIVWIGQGLGLIGGSFMSGQPFWAGAGIVALVVGIAVIALARRPASSM